jgi:microcin C transport system substrate-binding protein
MELERLMGFSRSRGLSKGFFCGALAVLMSAQAWAAPSHCLSLYGSCKYPEGFHHFDYVNPQAPKGGAVKLYETGTFDSLNPFILKGVKAPGLTMAFEPLMVSSQDEPQTVYGLIARTIEVAKDNTSVTFSLRKEAKFSDGTPITPEDVVFSFNTLKEKGDPTYKIMLAPLASAQVTGEREVTFTIATPDNREAPLIAASIFVFSKAYYAKVDFEKTTLEAPLSSGPYVVEALEQGKFITYKRNPNYWGKDLAVNRGQYNFDTIRYDMYRDENVALEGLKAGAYDFRREYIARTWATAYDVPAVRDGRIIKREIPDGAPQGMQSFVFNTRQPKFADARVREAISNTLDYEWVNKTIFYDAYLRNNSFFKNTEFEAKGVPAGAELALLKRFAKDLPPALFTQPFTNPKTDGSGNPRANLLRAQALLEEAGWVIRDGKRVNAATGEPLTIEFMLRQPSLERVIGPMRKHLERLGISSTIRQVDDAQYQKRTDSFDFDIVSVWLNRGVFFPGSEQQQMWHSSQAAVKGSANLAGLNDPVVDALLAELLSAKNKDALVAAGRALDRVLLWRQVVIPHWHSGSYRVAYWDKFGMPPAPPKYNLGFQAWWVKPAK